MSRKHYKELARILAELRDGVDALEFDRTISHLCSFLKSDNPNFNSTKFREAVYKN